MVKSFPHQNYAYPFPPTEVELAPSLSVYSHSTSCPTIHFLPFPTVVTIRFTELDYRVREHLGPVPVALQRDVQIATPIVLMVTPLNYTEFIDSGTPLPPDFPEIGDAANATCGY